MKKASQSLLKDFLPGIIVVALFILCVVLVSNFSYSCNLTHSLWPYVGYSFAEGDVCQPFLYLWGESTIFHAPGQFLTNAFILVELNQGIMISIIVILSSIVAFFFTYRFARLTNIIKVLGVVLLLVLLYISVSYTLVQNSGSMELKEWEEACFPLDEEVIHFSYEMCTVVFYNISNAPELVAENKHLCLLPVLPNELSINQFQDVLFVINKSGVDEITRVALLVKCLCEHDASPDMILGIRPFITGHYAQEFFDTYVTEEVSCEIIKP